MSLTRTGGANRDKRRLDPELRAALGGIARVPQLLVGCDYDGTLAPLVDDPAAAGPLPEAVAAVRALAALPQTVVAVISGRALRDLATLSRLPSEVHLVGSHGSEFDLGFIQRLAPEQPRAPRPAARRAARRSSRDHPGVRLETKPASVAVHVRGADPDVSERALAGGPTAARRPGRRSTSRTARRSSSSRSSRPTRARRSTSLRMQASASAVLFLGDDVTDENAFAQLHGPDVGIKIGAGETLASYRVDEPIDAVRVLGLVLETAAALALRRSRGSDRAALDARERLDGRAPRAGCQGDVAVPPSARLGGHLRRHARRLAGRATSRSRPSARGSRSASATGRGR